MVSAECEPITGVWGLCPQWCPEADRAPFLCCHMPEMAQSCHVYELCYGQRVCMRNVAAEF